MNLIATHIASLLGLHLPPRLALFLRLTLIDLALAAAPDVAAAVIALRRHVGVHILFEGGPHQENKDIGNR